MLLVLVIIAILGYVAYQIYKATRPVNIPKREPPAPPRSITLAQLNTLDGTKGKPACFAVKGDVFDVTGVPFYTGSSPYAMFVGFEASVNLARMGFDKNWLNNPEEYKKLTKDEMDILNDWHAKFKTKYKFVGTLVQ